MLRAGDLPRAYSEGDDTACGIATTEEGPTELEQLFAQDHPRACVIELNRIWSPRRTVTSAAFVFDDAAAAKRGFQARAVLLPYSASLEAAESQVMSLGDEARLVSGRGLNDPAVAVVWRRDNVVAILAVEPASGSTARRLATEQERRLEGRLAAKPPRDSVELPLDDPALTLPVYWLGREFDAPGLPTLRLAGAANVARSGPGNTVKLDYGGVEPNRIVGVTIDLWTPGAWRRFERTLLGRLVWDSPCARKTVVRLPAGHAEIYAGYGTPQPLQRPCPRRAPDRVIAHVYFGGVVAAVDMPYCYACARPSTPSPFETVAGMTAIARGLELRRR